VRLLILTAQRRGELAGMRWENVDLKSCLWTLPKEQTKSGRVHDVPLSRQTVEILRELPRFERGSYVFTTTSGEKPVVGFSKAKRILDREILKRAGQKGRRLEYTMHDFRRTAATWLAQHGTPPHVLSAVLNHSPGAQQGVTAIYNRYRYSEERREALERWAEYVASLGKAKAQRRAS
jgi:integrase